jgi:uncharacterized lipoprotein YbaY
MNFVASLDVVGGSSGSPVVDADGRLVGVVFDGNLFSLAGYYWYDGDLNRTVAVATPAMLEALEKIYRAERLLEEIRAGTDAREHPRSDDDATAAQRPPPPSARAAPRGPSATIEEVVVTVEISAEGGQRPAPGTPLRVELRDVSLADAPSEVIARAEGSVRGSLGRWLETIELSVPELPESSTIWVHVDVDRDGKVSPGDFITTAAYPVSPGEEARVTVSVRRV